MQINVQLLKRRLFEDSAVQNVKFFPGSNRDVSADDIAGEINRYFVDAENGGAQEKLNVEADLDA
ncbi:hypothetical protein GCM10007420_02250 [Glycocaulis albus]|uniref:Uncharacterized protein n=1 Tax=Glycocaulis albus TaxID=1382801 RepID=A0ABQ1XCP8_9PROT|nr:hypothetical protein [Glycocaulis albus]GGG90642.1 hypothetical protein GCM10007420_02250 [Glycocaulis albus]